MYLDEYKKWLNSTMLSENEKEELKSIANDEKEIESRFYTNLSFGTAGMRGIRGIGKNRMNKYNIFGTTIDNGILLYYAYCNFKKKFRCTN